MKTLWLILHLLFTTTLMAAPYVAKDYSKLLGMSGFSDGALKTHFKLYEGYVKNTNAILDELQKKPASSANAIDYAGLKRQLMWEFDGMRLHEFYFDNLGGDGVLDSNSDLAQALIGQFGSLEAWKADFIATGAMRGIGWAVLYRDPQTGRLVNTWINEHDRGHLSGGDPILIMDVFEHAYLLDYGIDRLKYIDAFFKNIHWGTVQARFVKHG